MEQKAAPGLFRRNLPRIAVFLLLPTYLLLVAEWPAVFASRAVNYAFIAIICIGLLIVQRHETAELKKRSSPLTDSASKYTFLALNAIAKKLKRSRNVSGDDTGTGGA